MAQGNFLLISDLQIPFEHHKALEFCRYLKRHFQVPDENVYNVGDELDQYWGGLWDKDPDASMTANQEIQKSVETLKTWYDAFPRMKLCDSNHGTRWKRKAMASSIPSQLMRLYREVIQAPNDWLWQKHWTVDAKRPFRVEHGDDWGGQYPHTQAALHLGISVVMGHHHSKVGIQHIKTSSQSLWGMVTGCLINFEEFAFNYARAAKFKPITGCGVVSADGRQPIWVPME
jgi:UDP-2,3-diacylglucosamine pyrophosphatase LpxH